MLDKENVPPAGSLGNLGVNLINGAFYHHSGNRKRWSASVLDQLTWERVEGTDPFAAGRFEGVDSG